MANDIQKRIPLGREVVVSGSIRGIVIGTTHHRGALRYMVRFTRDDETRFVRYMAANEIYWSNRSATPRERRLMAALGLTLAEVREAVR